MDGEGCAFAWHRFDIDAAAHLLGKLSGDAKAQAVAAMAFAPVKQFSKHSGINAHTGVADSDFHSFTEQSETDPDTATARGEFDGIGDQILHHAQVFSGIDAHSEISGIGGKYQGNVVGGGLNIHAPTEVGGDFDDVTGLGGGFQIGGDHFLQTFDIFHEQLGIFSGRHIGVIQFLLNHLGTAVDQLKGRAHIVDQTSVDAFHGITPFHSVRLLKYMQADGALCLISAEKTIISAGKAPVNLTLMNLRSIMKGQTEGVAGLNKGLVCDEGSMPSEKGALPDDF